MRISITDRDVRFNMGLNLNFVDEASPTRREMPDVVDPVEEEMVRQSLLAYFRSEHAVTIDGVEVAPVIEEYKLIRLDRKNLALFPKTGMRALTRFSVVLSYPFKTPPQRVAMRWGRFPEDTLSEEAPRPDGSRPSMIIQALVKAEGVVEQVVFSESGPEVVWVPSGTTIDERLAAVPAPEPGSATALPMVSAGLLTLWLIASAALVRRHGVKAVVLLGVPAITGAVLIRDVARVPIGGAPLTEEQAIAVFRPLHANVYRAFDYSAESDIYDALERSVAGDLLDELYGQIHRGLVQAEHGGSVGRVTRVDLGSADVIGIADHGAVFEVEASWLVEGTVYHWGHSHPRETSYRASYTVAADDGRWRIVGSEVLSSEHLTPETDRFVPPEGSL